MASRSTQPTPIIYFDPVRGDGVLVFDGTSGYSAWRRSKGIGDKISTVEFPRAIVRAIGIHFFQPNEGGCGGEWYHCWRGEGVGDSENFLVQALGGAVGAGLIARIVRGYTFISRNYMPGDRIYIVGFSRGAYTARALAGMIARKGLLDATKTDLTDRNKAYALGTAVWYDYRRDATRAKPNAFDALESVVDLLPGFVSRTQVVDGQLIAAPIEVVAVWDTVGALGIPVYTLEGSTLDVFQFADRVLSDAAKHGVHAVAVDEQRADFTPTLWDADPRIVQALFPGCHSDVGGGFVLSNDESGLSDCTLNWMTEALADRGATFLATPMCTPNPDSCGIAHAPWLDGIWRFLPRGLRCFPGRLYLAEEVVARAAAVAVVPYPGAPAAGYAPVNLMRYLEAGGPAAGLTVV